VSVRGPGSVPGAGFDATASAIEGSVGPLIGYCYFKGACACCATLCCSSLIFATSFCFGPK
jgi:hypothetical protein